MLSSYTALDVESVLDQILQSFSAPISFVFIGGTASEGLSHVYSDIDIYVVCQESSDRPAEPSNIDIIYHNGLEFHIIATVHDELQSKYSKLGTWVSVKEIVSNGTSWNVLFARARRNVEMLTKNDIKIGHRIWTAVPIYNEEKFFELRGQLSLSNLRYMAAVRHAMWIWYAHQDAIGMFRSGDYLSVYATTRTMVERCLLCVLALHGFTNDKPKWIVRQLVTAFGVNSSFLADVMKLWNSFTLEPTLESSALHLDHCLHLAQLAFDIVVQVALGANPSNMKVDERYSCQPPFRTNSRPDAAIRNPNVAIATWHGELMLISNLPLAQITPVAAAVWCEIDGQSDAERILCAIQDRYPDSSSLNISTSNVMKIIDEFVEAGFATVSSQYQ